MSATETKKEEPADRGVSVEIEDIRAAQRGNRAAFDRLVDLNRSFVTSLCRRSLQNDEEANDAAQETFILAWRHLETFQQGETLKPWLGVIAKRVCLTRIRTKSGKDSLNAPRLTDKLAEELTESFGNRAPTGHEEADARMYVEQKIARFWTRGQNRRPPLRIEDLHILRYRIQHNYTWAEIAECVKMPTGTVKWRYDNCIEPILQQIGKDE